MSNQNDLAEMALKKQTDTIRVELGDWLYNAGIVGLMKILSENESEITSEIDIHETYIEFNKSTLEGLADRFFEVAFEMHGKFDSIKSWLDEVKVDVESILESERIEYLGKKYRVSNPDQKKLCKKITDELSKRWKGVAYESFQKIKKSEINDLVELKALIENLIDIQQSQRDFFVQKEVQTFLRGSLEVAVF